MATSARHDHLCPFSNNKPSRTRTLYILLIVSSVFIVAWFIMCRFVNNVDIALFNLQMQENQSIYTLKEESPIQSKICSLLFPSEMQWYRHHKSGVVLAKNLWTHTNTYCNKRVQLYQKWLGYFHFNDNYKSNKTVKCHFWRDPVLQIVSGFAYHVHSNELWSTHTLSNDLFNLLKPFWKNSLNLTHILDQYNAIMFQYDNVRKSYPEMWTNTLSDQQNHIYQRFFYPHMSYIRTYPIQRQRVRYLYLYYVNFVIYNGYVIDNTDFYGFYVKLNDRKLEEEINAQNNIFTKHGDRVEFGNFNEWFGGFVGSKKDDRIVNGLYFELRRFLWLIFPEIYDTHFNEIENRSLEFKMETWVNHFDENANVLLDALNMIDNERNRVTLFGNSSENGIITKEREYLLLQYQRENVNNNKDDHHMHINRNDTKYIDILLTMDPQICLLLKHLTNVIQYGWVYHNYC